MDEKVAILEKKIGFSILTYFQTEFPEAVIVPDNIQYHVTLDLLNDHQLLFRMYHALDLQLIIRGRSIVPEEKRIIASQLVHRLIFDLENSSKLRLKILYGEETITHTGNGILNFETYTSIMKRYFENDESVSVFEHDIEGLFYQALHDDSENSTPECEYIQAYGMEGTILAEAGVNRELFVVLNHGSFLQIIPNESMRGNRKSTARFCDLLLGYGFSVSGTNAL